MRESISDTKDQDEDLRIVLGLLDKQTERKEFALAALLRRHGGVIRAMVWKKFGNALQEGEVQDVLFRTAAKAWQYAETFDDSKASLRTWLVTIALRETCDILGEKSPQGFEPLFDEESVEQPHSSTEWREEDENDVKKDKKVIQDLKSIVAELPDLQRCIVEADLQCGGPADAGRLAEIHGTSKNSIYVSRKKAKDKIRQELIRLGHYCPEQHTR